jgi:hypothetical protein
MTGHDTLPCPSVSPAWPGAHGQDQAVIVSQASGEHATSSVGLLAWNARLCGVLRVPAPAAAGGVRAGRVPPPAARPRRHAMVQRSVAPGVGQALANPRPVWGHNARGNDSDGNSMASYGLRVVEVETHAHLCRPIWACRSCRQARVSAANLRHRRATARCVQQEPCQDPEQLACRKAADGMRPCDRGYGLRTPCRRGGYCVSTSVIRRARAVSYDPHGRRATHAGKGFAEQGEQHAVVACASACPPGFSVTAGLRRCTRGRPAGRGTRVTAHAAG